MIITCGMLLAFAAAGAAVITVGSPLSGHPSSLTQTAAAPPARENRSAKITITSSGNGCSQQTFDNQTGRFARSQQPCDTTQIGNDGSPVDPDAIRRFNELKKSFASH